MDGWVVGLGVFLDGIASLGLDGYFAFGFLFRDFTTRSAAIPIPGGWNGRVSS